MVVLALLPETLSVLILRTAIIHCVVHPLLPQQIFEIEMKRRWIYFGTQVGTFTLSVVDVPALIL